MVAAPLGVLLLLWRHDASSRGANVGWSLGELDLLDWIDSRALKPGDNFTEFFYGERR